MKPCPNQQCGTKATICHDLAVVTIYCNECYDGAPDAGSQPHVWGRTEKEAMQEWDDLCDMWEDWK